MSDGSMVFLSIGNAVLFLDVDAVPVAPALRSVPSVDHGRHGTESVASTTAVAASERHACPVVDNQSSPDMRGGSPGTPAVEVVADAEAGVAEWAAPRDDELRDDDDDGRYVPELRRDLQAEATSLRHLRFYDYPKSMVVSATNPLKCRRPTGAAVTRRDTPTLATWPPWITRTRTDPYTTDCSENASSWSHPTLSWAALVPTRLGRVQSADRIATSWAHSWATPRPRHVIWAMRRSSPQLCADQTGDPWQANTTHPGWATTLLVAVRREMFRRLAQLHELRRGPPHGPNQCPSETMYQRDNETAEGVRRCRDEETLGEAVDDDRAEEARDCTTGKPGGADPITDWDDVPNPHADSSAQRPLVSEEFLELEKLKEEIKTFRHQLEFVPSGDKGGDPAMRR